MDNIVISAENLSSGYGKAPVINDISFEVRQGEILTLIGPNGAGKSTVLKAISGYLEKICGTVVIDGKSSDEISSQEMAKRLSVMLTERIRPELMTCREVVETGRYPYTGRFGLLTEKDKAAANKAIESVEIEDLADKDFNSVSDGQKQRVMLARAICQEPDILILDEPTSYLDIRHKIIFFEALRKLLMEKKIGIIISMHELDLAEKVSDHILCIKYGKIIRTSKPADIFTAENIRELYGISEELYRKYF